MIGLKIFNKIKTPRSYCREKSKKLCLLLKKINKIFTNFVVAELLVILFFFFCKKVHSMPKIFSKAVGLWPSYSLYLLPLAKKCIPKIMSFFPILCCTSDWWPFFCRPSKSFFFVRRCISLNHPETKADEVNVRIKALEVLLQFFKSGETE